MNRNAFAERGGKHRQDALFVAIERHIRMPSLRHPREDGSRPRVKPDSVIVSIRCKGAG